MGSNAENTSKDSNLVVKFENRLSSLSVNGIDFDCEFVVGSENVAINGHKLVFAAGSDVFRAMFYGELKEDKVIKVEDLHPDGFEGMKHFLYTGKVNFTSAIHALLTYVAAGKYLIPLLSKECTKYIEEKIHPSEVLEFFEYCKSSDISEFDELCCKVVQSKTDEVVDSEYFVTAKIETIEMILQCPSLKLKSEIEVFGHFERWAEAEAGRKSISVGEMASSFNRLKKHIRFLTMSGDQFVSRVVDSLFLTHEEKLIIGVNQIKFNAKQMPDCLSQTRQHRDFISSLVTPVQYKHTFIVTIDSTCQSCTRYDITLGMCITATNFKDFVCFVVKTIIVRNSPSLIFLIKTNLRVLAENSCDDLLFDNECYLKVDPSITGSHPGVTIAAIPNSKLNQECFLRGTDNTVTILGSFSINIITKN